MLFKTDENLPDEIVVMLVNSGHDAATVFQQKMKGTSDPELFNICNQEKRILVTLDTDFSDIRTYPPRQHHGIIVLRISNQSKRNVLNIFQSIILALRNEPIDKHLWIVEENKLRIRS